MNDWFGYFIILFVIGFIIKIYFESEMFHLKCIVSDEDGNTYCVRETPKLELVADLLARTTEKLKQLVEYVKEEYPNRENVKRLAEKFNPRKISETLPTSKYTAYSENKGEKLAFCTTTTKEGSKLIDENTLAFVAVHELGHVMTESVGHTKEFWQNFKFLLKNAVKIGIYEPIDYKKKPKNYCGMKITDNPYYDL
uniref:WLM domain-containing protein n=1 Tax=viral metagenome TaxID=1070528 RepID=A0A6C0KFJ5_9ZZZZ